jgi:hypothetical protein
MTGKQNGVQKQETVSETGFQAEQALSQKLSQVPSPVKKSCSFILFKNQP